MVKKPISTLDFLKAQLYFYAEMLVDKMPEFQNEFIAWAISAGFQNYSEGQDKPSDIESEEMERFTEDVLAPILIKSVKKLDYTEQYFELVLHSPAELFFQIDSDHQNPHLMSGNVFDNVKENAISRLIDHIRNDILENPDETYITSFVDSLFYLYMSIANFYDNLRMGITDEVTTKIFDDEKKFVQRVFSNLQTK